MVYRPIRRRKLDKALKKMGFEIFAGSNHDRALFDNGDIKFTLTLPRHREISPIVVKSVSDDLKKFLDLSESEVDKLLK